MEISKKVFDKYRSIVVEEYFKNVDINTITDEMIIAEMQKGYVYYKENKKLLCLNCGFNTRVKESNLKEEKVCTVCLNEFVI